MTTLEGVTPYPPEFVARYRASGFWQDQSMATYFDAVCSRFSERVALVANNEYITYQQLATRAERLALHLLKLGLHPRDRFILQLPNIPEFVYLYLALQKVGVIPVMALAAQRYAEIQHFVKLSEAVGYALPERIGDFSFTELAAKLQHEHASLRLLFVAGQTDQSDWVSLSELLQTESGLPRERLAEIEIDPMLPALFQLSGGTTGVPKLIPRTHNDYIYNSIAAAAINDIHPDDALLAVLPLAHNFPLACPGIQGFLMHGARTVLSTSTRSEDIFKLIEEEHITHIELVPTLLIRLLNDPLLKQYDVSSLRVINTGGQKLQSEVKRRAEALLPTCKVQEVFGMAEGLLCYVRLDDADEMRYETAGRPVSAADELRLVDDNGNDVPDGEIGELLVRGPYTLRGYFRAPEHNARTFTSDGFYRSGDLLRRHPSGNYSVEGRKKDLINRGGEKISAEEIENLLLAHPSVLNVACVPMPDAVLGERMCAFVMPRPAMTLTLEEVKLFLLEKGIAKFKLPERLELISELPLSKVGKVLKQILIQQAKAFDA
ncbi:MAG: (2,3-dihydroxybenzoyl)adenylate synthase [Ktedonobacteraceae bacterium]